MEFLKWIDRSLNEINKTSVFLNFFGNIDLEQIEDRLYLENEEQGIDIVLSLDFIITSVHVKLIRDDKKLPNSLEFGMTKLQVEKTLGEAQRNGGGFTDVFGEIPFWLKYYLEGYSLHIQFRSESIGGEIEMITLGSLTLEESLK